MTIKEHKDLILKWLYSRRSEGFINIGEFYSEHDVETTREEAILILQSLQKKGFIVGHGSKHIMVMLKPDGAEYIEELTKVSEYEPSDKFTSTEQKDITIRLDQLADKLHKIEVGQQIIYDDLLEEIETLKKLLNVLGKKDWRQQLKGKLVDQGLGSLTKEAFNVIADVFKDQNLLNN